MKALLMFCTVCIFIIGAIFCIAIINRYIGVNLVNLFLILLMFRFILSIVYINAKTRTTILKQLIRSVMVMTIVFAILLFSSLNLFRISVNALNNLSDISHYVISRTYTDHLPNFVRSNYDLYLWVLLGGGHCDEMAFIAKNILEEKGYEVYIAGFPGEDHYFAIVRINDSWIVVDPGYFPRRAIPLDKRVECRIREYGNISSIIAYIIEQDTFKLAYRYEGFIELTQYYLPYDTFVIRITYKGHPIAGAQVVLKHRFHGDEVEIPGKGLCFYTNGSGYVVIHLSGSMYNKSDANPYDLYFEIYVNGRHTGKYIQSTMSGKTHYIEIDLYELG